MPADEQIAYQIGRLPDVQAARQMDVQLDVHPDSQMTKCTDMQPTGQIPVPADRLIDKCLGSRLLGCQICRQTEIQMRRHQMHVLQNRMAEQAGRQMHQLQN